MVKKKNKLEFLEYKVIDVCNMSVRAITILYNLNVLEVAFKIMIQ